MSLLTSLHDLQFRTGLAFLFPTPLALATLLLFLWSLRFLARTDVPRAFVTLVRVTWVLALLPAITGVLLALGGAKTASATRATAEELARNCPAATPAQDLTRYCLPYDPSRNLEHWMYASFVILSLVMIELMLRGRFLSERTALRLIPVAALFLYGVAYMVGRVAVFPGSTPGA
ncbi:hypothetical protein [Deinococcus maricopensis]|uniref:Uncharacterized protein n=1 Tax=Deinococcus maricopensis (strain DSM 21211 / LMG 22137 / NRRL B-23946 / LB-34) TaxID=709986 RepID=E8U7S3_DEIML|nr:hypothetical protein [Deinococcus maricopensis]ADV67112.1 hypothetical protein Deima_1463 [Deinococcus maricopensis DSM 21211]